MKESGSRIRVRVRFPRTEAPRPRTVPQCGAKSHSDPDSPSAMDRSKSRRPECRKIGHGKSYSDPDRSGLAGDAGSPQRTHARPANTRAQAETGRVMRGVGKLSPKSCNGAIGHEEIYSDALSARGLRNSGFLSSSSPCKSNHRQQCGTLDLPPHVCDLLSHRVCGICRTCIVQQA